MANEFALASVKGGSPKKYNLKELIDNGAIVTDPAHPAFQERNLQPLNPETTRSLKDSGGWDPSKPGTLTKWDGKLIVVDGNTRTRQFHSVGIEEGYFVEVKLAAEEPMELHRLRLHSNNATGSDPWTTAATFADGEKRGLTPEEQAIGVSPSTVKKYLRIYHVIMSLGPKPKAEEKAEQTAERLAKAKHAQESAIAKIRTGLLTLGDILKFFERDLPPEDFDKAFASLIKKKKEEKAAAKTEVVKTKLEEYDDQRVPPKFFPAFVAMIAAAPDLSQASKNGAIAALNVVMGLLPRTQFLAGDFTLPEPKEVKKKGTKKADVEDDEEEAEIEEDDSPAAA
jgi:hypothetical protein